MYVRLISSDSHEFIVKREHALTSGTIKAMLSGPGQFDYIEKPYFKKRMVRCPVPLIPTLGKQRQVDF